MDTNKKITRIILISTLLIIGYFTYAFFRALHDSDAVARQVRAQQLSDEKVKLDLYAQQHVDRFCYNNLSSETDRELYLKIYEKLLGREEVLNGIPSDNDYVYEIFTCVFNDHPEMFWVEPQLTFYERTRDGIPYAYYVEFSYNSLSSIEARQDQIDQEIEGILDMVKDYHHPYDKVKKVYEYLIRGVSYDERNTDQSLYSALVLNTGVCAGYARAFQYIMDCLGIPSTYVTGDLIDDENQSTSYWYEKSPLLRLETGHAWNLVNIEGDWYHVDVTSGDAASDNEIDSDYISYSYLCLTTQEITKTHTIGPMMKLPQCISDRYDYFKLSGSYFDDYDRLSFERHLAATFPANSSQVEVKFASASGLQRAYANLFEEGAIFDIFDTLGVTDRTVHYSIDSLRNILYISKPNSLIAKKLSNTIPAIAVTDAWEVGKQGPAGGLIVIDKGFYSDGWRYSELLPKRAEIGSFDWYVASMTIDDFSYFGYEDWSLPTIEELEQIDQLDVSSEYSLFPYAYWSSTSKSSDTASYYHFLKGRSYDVYKWNSFRVRPVRRF